MSIEHQIRKLIPALAIPALLCGCVTQPKPLLTSFNEAEFAPYAATGTSSITGQAFLKTRGGEVRLGAGNTVKLLPVTSYTTELRNRVTIGGERIIGQLDPRIERYMRKATADAGGNFEFHNLPAGYYYVTCIIIWETATGYQGALQRTGGVAYGTVKVGEGETAKVVVTRQ